MIVPLRYKTLHTCAFPSFLPGGISKLLSVASVFVALGLLFSPAFCSVDSFHRLSPKRSTSFGVFESAMPYSSSGDSGDENLAVADFLNAIHSSDDEDTPPSIVSHSALAMQSTSGLEQRKQQPRRAPLQGEPPKARVIHSAAHDHLQQQREGLAHLSSGDGGDDSRGEIDLASIRAVYKAEVENGQALDCVLRSKEDYENVREEHLQVARSELGEGLDAFVIDNVMSKDECSGLIDVVEGMGFSFWNPASLRKDYRNADTVEVTNSVLAERIWGRIQHLVVPSVTIRPGQSRWSRELEGTWEAVGVNPNMLFNRYGPGGHFSPHTDGYTILDFNVRSMFSCLLYLNDCPLGGATRMMEESADALTDHNQERFVLDGEGRHRFEEHRVRASVSPRSGKALLFFQDTLHEGEPVGEGHCKYMIRTDILYQRTPKLFDSPTDRAAYELFREAELTEAEDAGKAAKMFMKFARMAPALAEVYGI